MKKEKCKCRYGYYNIPRIKRPDETIFRLRINALLLNVDFKNFCSNPKIADMERDVLSAWDNFPVWAEDHKEDYCLIALLFYGNIFQHGIGFTWTRFKNTMTQTYNANRSFHFCELSPGTPAPPDSRTISFDPELNNSDLLRLFQGFLSTLKSGNTVKPSLKHPLSGYFELQPKVKLKEVSRFIDAATRFAEIKTNSEHPDAWLTQMTKLYKGYPGNVESKRKTIYKDIKKGQNIAYWALRGLFPKTSNPPK